MHCSEHCADLDSFCNRYGREDTTCTALNTVLIWLSVLSEPHQTELEVCGWHQVCTQDCHLQASGCFTESPLLTTHCITNSTHTSPTHLSGAGLHRPVLQQLLVCPGDMLHHSNHPGNASSDVLYLLGEGEEGRRGEGRGGEGGEGKGRGGQLTNQ